MLAMKSPNGHDVKLDDNNGRQRLNPQTQPSQEYIRIRKATTTAEGRETRAAWRGRTKTARAMYNIPRETTRDKFANIATKHV